MEIDRAGLEDAPFRDDDGYIPPHIELAVRIRGRNLHARVLEALLERFPRHDALAGGSLLLLRLLLGPLGEGEVVPPRLEAGFGVCQGGGLLSVCVRCGCLGGRHEGRVGGTPGAAFSLVCSRACAGWRRRPGLGGGLRGARDGEANGEVAGGCRGCWICGDGPA